MYIHDTHPRTDTYITHTYLGEASREKADGKQLIGWRRHDSIEGASPGSYGVLTEGDELG